MNIIETSIFTRRIQDTLSHDEYHQLQNFLIDNPAAGDIIKGSGGLRKIRWHGLRSWKKRRIKNHLLLDNCKKYHPDAFCF